jgi:phosphate-selective porin OprO/OprP
MRVTAVAHPACAAIFGASLLKTQIYAALLLTGAISPASVLAQTSSDVEAMRAEISRLRAELESLEARLGKVEGAGSTQAVPAQAAATPPSPVPAVDKAKPETAIEWRGAPQLSTTDGRSFKPRGRLQLDSNVVSRPMGITAPTLGWSSDVRRAYLGVDGKLGGGIGYRLEVDFATGDVQLTDAWLTYEKGPLTFTLGHHRVTTLEDLTSDLETSFLERAAFTQAFGFERRLGFSASYEAGDVQVTAGVFSDDLGTLGTSGVTTNSYSFDGRIVFMPKVGDTQLHFGGSAHYRALNDLTNSLRYRARPGARTTDVRFVDTGTFSAKNETGYGVEFAALRGPIHVAAEGFWQKVDRPVVSDASFFGAYGEIGYVFAGGSGRGYRDGVFTSIKPQRGIDKGGTGAWQINLRADWLNLNNGLIIGGRQQSWGASLVWVPIERVKFLANYLRSDISDTPVRAGSLNDYSVDVFGLRAQYEF